MAETLFSEIASALAWPVLAVLDLGERVAWLYLGSAFLMALGVWLFKLTKRVSLGAFLFPSSIWFHPSALFDLRLMVARSLISSLLLGPLLVGSAYIAIFSHSYLIRYVGLSFLGPMELTTGLLLVSASALTSEDFARYWVHRLAHRIGFLWALHQVHHSAAVLTPFTIYRAHPLDAWLLRATSSFALGVGAGSSAWFFSVDIAFWQILGVSGLSVIWNTLGSNLRHSHIWLSYPLWLQKIFISPSQHQIHHSVQKRHHDKNFGSIFAIWDLLFGTLHQTQGRELLKFGIEPGELNHQERVVSALFDPLLASCRKVFLPNHDESVRDK